jgi:hypothetical protein
MILAGLYVDKHGICVEEAAVEVLRHTLLEYTVKTQKDAQHVIGVVQYTNSAFDFGDDDWTKYIQFLSVLIDHSNATPFRWGDDCTKACKQLCTHIANMPRAYMDPVDLLSASSCSIAHTDAGNYGICNTLFLVQISCATQVKDDDLRNRSISRLISVKYHRLSKAEQKWQTYEAEMFGIVRIKHNFGSYITALTMKYPPSCGMKKIGLWNDSSTAISKWKTLHIPEGTIDHLSAKARRMYNWADETAGCTYWNADIRHFPGEQISIAHMCTTMGQGYMEKHAELKTAGTTIVVAPMTVFSFHPDPPQPLPAAGIPEGYKAYYLPIDPSDTTKIIEAYLIDTVEYLRVPLHDIYKMVANVQRDTVPSMHQDKIKPWIGKTFLCDHTF